MQQLDLVEYIEEQERAEAASKAALGDANLEEGPMPTPAVPMSASEAEPIPACAVQVKVLTPSLESFEEVVDVQKAKPPAPLDYRALLRPVQKMLVGLEGKPVLPGEKQRRLAVCACGFARGQEVGVHLVARGGTETATVTGIYRCGNGEACPFCAPYVAALRAKRYRLVHEAIVARSGRILTLTLTMAHAPADTLEQLLTAIKWASTKIRSGGLWNRKIRLMLKSAGALRDIHVRWSRNGGWHPHIHLTIACLTNDQDAIRSAADMLIGQYVKLLATAGFHADIERQTAAILENDPDERRYAYPAHHHRPAEVEGNLRENMDEETSLSPFDIASLAAEGDAEMAKLFVEFVQAMRGTKCAVITAPMALALGIEQDADTAPILDDTTKLGTLPSPVWTGLINENLVGTFLGNVATFGRSGWRRVWWWAHTETGMAPPILEREADAIIDLLKAAHLLVEPDTKALAHDIIAQRLAVWTDRHGPVIVAATKDYAEAHWRYVDTDHEAMATLTMGIEVWANKLAVKRWWAKHDTPVPMPPVMAEASDGATPFVAQNQNARCP